MAKTVNVGFGNAMENKTREKTVQNIMQQLDGLSFEEAASILQAVHVELIRSLKVVLNKVEPKDISETVFWKAFLERTLTAYTTPLIKLEKDILD